MCHEYIEQQEKIKRFMAINDANSLVQEMQHEVDKYTKLLEFAKQDQVYVITHNVDYFQFILRIVGAKDYYQRENFDKRSKEYKDSKSMAQSLQKYLEEEVFKKPISIIKIYSYGYEGYYEEVVFTIPNCDTKFSFTVPNPEKINTKNFQNTNECKLEFGYYKNDLIHEIVKSSYCVEDITNAFEEFILKEEV
jgi:hypothetical protein